MKTTQTQPLIFKTNIGSICPNCAVHKALDSNSAVQDWSLDHEDVDCVLRIVSDTLTPAMVISMINLLGYDCLEMHN